MNRRFALLAAAALLGAAAPHKPARRVAPPPPPPPLGDTVQVALTTEAGVIVVELDHKHAPITVENFMRYVDTKRYDGASFYRAMHLNWPDLPPDATAGLIQGGVRDPRLLYPPIEHEPTNRTGILHKAGTLSLARFAPGSGRADFSILLWDMAGLDAQPDDPNPDRQAGFAAFGHVVSGMDVARRIWSAPRSPTLGEGVMKGQMLEKPVKILSARRLPMPAPAP